MAIEAIGSSTPCDALTIKTLGDEGGVWDSFVAKRPEASFFHHSGWISILEEEFGCKAHCLYAERQGRIVGVLPLFEVKNLLAGHVLISSPFLVYGGPVGEDEMTCSALADAATALARKLAVDSVELRNRSALQGDWLLQSRHATFRKALLPSVGDNLSAIPRKQRAMVRKGLKAGVTVSWDWDLEQFYGVFSESYRNLGTPVFGRSLFERIKSTFGDAVWMTTLHKDGITLASVISFVDGDEILPYYGGGGAAARDYAANDLMYWTVMERAVEEGLCWYDFGRSKENSGSYSFKKHWGFEPQPLAYQYRLIRAKKLPNLTPTNPRFQLPIEAWKRLPLSVSRVLGPRVARLLA